MILALLIAASGSGPPATFIEGPRRANGDRPWLAENGQRLSVCWSTPTQPNDETCWEPLPAPPSGSGGGRAQRVRFADPETLELLDSDDQLFRWTRGRANWELSEPAPSPDQASLMRSTLFLEGVERPCAAGDELVPASPADKGWSWTSRPCAHPCRTPELRAIVWPQRPLPSLRLFVSGTGEYSRRSRTLLPDERTTRTLSRQHTVILGLQLGLHARAAPRPLRPRGSEFNAPPDTVGGAEANALLAREEYAALRSIRCGESRS